MNHMVVCYAQSPSIDNVVIHQDKLLEDEIVCDVEFRYVTCPESLIVHYVVSCIVLDHAISAGVLYFLYYVMHS